MKQISNEEKLDLLEAVYAKWVSTREFSERTGTGMVASMVDRGLMELIDREFDKLYEPTDAILRVLQEAFDVTTVDKRLWDELTSTDDGQRVNLVITALDLKRIGALIGMLPPPESAKRELKVRTWRSNQPLKAQSKVVHLATGNVGTVRSRHEHQIDVSFGGANFETLDMEDVVVISP